MALHRLRTVGVLPLVLLLAACAGSDPGQDPLIDPPEATLTEGVPAAGGATQDPEPAPPSPSPPETETAEGWTIRAQAPVALSEVAAAPFAGSIWTAGGFTGDGEATDVVLIYDPRTDSWAEGPSVPEPIHHAALVSTDDGLVLVGGYVGPGFDAPTDAVARLDITTGEWATGPPLPQPRAAGAAAWDGSRVVYAGGIGPDGLTADVWTLEDGAWRAIGELSQAREHLAAAADGQGRAFFLGGRTGGFDTNLTVVDLVDGEEVSRLGDLPTARGGVAGLHLPGVGACSLGGEGTTGTFTEVECIDVQGSVTTLPPLQQGRHGLGAVVVEGFAYAVLGGDEPGLFVTPTLEAISVPGGP